MSEYVRIKKGVKPYGGRKLLVIRWHENGGVTVNAPTSRGAYGDRGGMFTDPRYYSKSEIERITSKEGKP